MEKTQAQILAERLQDRLDVIHPVRRGQQSWLARSVGMKPQGIQSILAGGVERTKKLREMAVALKTSQSYLLGETDDPSPDEADTSIVENDADIIALLERISFIGPGRGERAMNLLKGFFGSDDATPEQTRRREKSSPSSRRHEQVP